MTEALAHDPVLALTPPWSGVSLVDLFASSCHLNAHAPAFAEAPFSSVAPPRRMTYLQANEAVDRLAIALGGLALPAGATVAVCLAGTIEAPLTLLAALRAGFVPCLVPPTVNRVDAAQMLREVKAEAIVAAASVGSLRPAETMRAAAVEHGPRYIMGFGARLPAGVLPLDDVIADAPETRVLRQDPPDGARPLSIVTVERLRGRIACYRHDQESLVAAALGTVLRAGISSGEHILSTVSPSTHAALATGLVPSLLTGGTLHLQALFDGSAFLRMLGDMPPPHVVVPGVMETPLAEAGLLGSEAVSSTIIVHRPPARLERRPSGASPHSPIVDILALGERGCLVARRATDGRPTLALGEMRVPDDDGPLVIASRQGPEGLVSVAGPAVATRINETFPDRETDWLATEVDVAADPEGQIVLATPAVGAVPAFSAD